jgi:hypothetical protein
MINRFLFITCILFSSCKPVVKTLGPFSSSSIEDSKKKGVFLWEYYPVNTKIYDTIDFSIKEVFAEKQYGYNSYKDLSYKISEEKVQIKIIAQKKLSELKYFEWWVVENFDWDGGCGLVRSYKQGFCAPDTLVVKILKVAIGANGLAGEEDKKEIGQFTLVKMK